ncbi:MAG: hypothetical protein H0V78_13995 [Burkholderiales bacterium]|nr:hypothetical protein [Burkholderiales bacterium]
MKKTLISTLVAATFGFGSTLAFANPNNNTQDDALINAQDNSVDATQSGGGANQDFSDNNSNNDDNSDNSDNSIDVDDVAVAVDDSAAANNHSQAYSDTSDSFNDSSTTVGDIGIAISASVLTGTVTDNAAVAVPIVALSNFETGDNEISGGRGAGINLASQNTGNAALTQQSVSVQANLNF